VEHPQLILRFGIALLIGLLVGLEREYARLKEEVTSFAGVRTFPLVIANTIVKGGIALTTGGAELRRALWPPFLLMLVTGAVVALLVI
jgi:uncharacterized membrane protein YhiD involved in acid resistance